MDYKYHFRLLALLSYFHQTEDLSNMDSVQYFIRPQRLDYRDGYRKRWCACSRRPGGEQLHVGLSQVQSGSGKLAVVSKKR